MTTPTHVRTNLVLPSPLAGFPSIYFPVIGKVLLFTAGTTELARLDLANLGSCALQRSAVPTLTSGGIILAVFLLLAVGSWFLGRRRGFSELWPLP